MAGCQALLGIQDRTVAEAGAGNDASGDGAMGIDPLCISPDIPPRPPMDTSSSSDSMDVVFALSAVDLGLNPNTNDPKRFGLNLDGHCTRCKNGVVQGSSCVQKQVDGGPKANPLALCDFEDDAGRYAGVDIAGRSTFQKAQSLGLVSEANLNASLKNGVSGALIRVQEWNGKPDDATVRVSVYSSIGTDGPDGGATPTRLDGTDKWRVDQNSVSGMDTSAPKYVDTNAYVSNNKLLSTLSFPITIGGELAQFPPVTMELNDVIILADIKMGAPIKIDGLIAGRWNASKALTSFQVFPDLMGGNVCGENNPSYILLRDLVCANLDIATSVNNDNTNSFCDASSIGIHFEATQAQFGRVVPHPPESFPCGPNWVAKCPGL